MHKDHVKHAEFVSMLDDRLGLFFRNLTVVPGKGLHPSLKSGADDDVRLQRMGARLVADPAAAGAHGNRTVQGVDQRQHLVIRHRLGRIAEIAERPGKEKTGKNTHPLHFAESPVFAPQDMKTKFQEGNFDKPGKDKECETSEGILFSGDIVYKRHNNYPLNKNTS